MKSTKRRAYTLRQRAEAQAGTRRRIVEAAMALHGSVGPARTTMSAVAERAGVQRHTVYRHFPTDEALFSACGQHFVAIHPPPAEWPSLSAGAKAVEAALARLYRWFEENQAHLSNVIRDADVVPQLAGPRLAHEGQVRAIVGGSTDRARRAAVWLATDFYCWRSLRDGGIDNAGAARIMTKAIFAA